MMMEMSGDFVYNLIHVLATHVGDHLCARKKGNSGSDNGFNSGNVGYLMFK